MVTNDDRNNLLIIIVVITTVIIATFLINGFIAKMQQITEHGERTMNTIGKQLVGNISNATQINTLNLQQFNQSMADVVESNDEIVVSNNATINNLTKVVEGFSKANVANGKTLKDLIANNSHTFAALLAEQHKTSLILANISKQLDKMTTTTNQTIHK